MSEIVSMLISPQISEFKNKTFQIPFFVPIQKPSMKSRCAGLEPQETIDMYSIYT